jgi:hypothetical protein
MYSKMVHLPRLHFTSSLAEAVARLCVDTIWRIHGMPLPLISDRDTRFTSALWKEGVRVMCMMSGVPTAYHQHGHLGAERPN